MLYEVTPLTRPPPRIVPLPIMVDPMEGEALISWCYRLASRLGLSPKQTAHMLGADVTDLAWWKYPTPERLVAMSRRSGVRVDRMRAMTFLDWKGLSSTPSAEQIIGRRLRTLQTTRSPKNQFYVICPKCLAGDQKPWLHRDWLTGWATVCSAHRLVLIERCWQCGVQLRFPGPGAERPHDPVRCRKCDADHRDAPAIAALPGVLELQQQIFTAMRTGSAEIVGLGRMEWSMIVLVVKLVLWVGWSSTNAINEKSRQPLFARVAKDLQIAPPAYDFWLSAYGAISLCSWLFANPSIRWSYMSGFVGRSSQKAPAPLEHAMPIQREYLQRLFDLDKPASVLGRRMPGVSQYEHPSIRQAPPIEGLKLLAGSTRNKAVRQRLTALLRLREGRTVLEVVQETGLPVRTVYRWSRKYRPDRFSKDHRITQSQPSNVQQSAYAVHGS